MIYLLVVYIFAYSLKKNDFLTKWNQFFHLVKNQNHLSGFNNSYVLVLVTSSKYSTIMAMLLFSRRENIESIPKTIACQNKQNVLLWKKMNERFFKTIQKTSLPFFLPNETSQIEKTFGDKITHSIIMLFVQGFEKVIVVGNDCIELKLHHLLESNTKFQTNDFVFGADFNGGPYLICVSRSVFKANKFEIISWQTPAVLNKLQSLFGKKNIIRLPSLNDFNSVIDLKMVVNKLPFSVSFRNLFYSLFQNSHVIKNFKTSIVNYRFSLLNLNKGSPFSF